MLDKKQAELKRALKDMGGDWVGDDPAVKMVTIDIELLISMLSNYQTRLHAASITPYPKAVKSIMVGHRILLKSDNKLMLVELCHDSTLVPHHDQEARFVSFESPLGLALLRAKKDSTISVNNGEWTVVTIAQSPLA